MQQAGYAIDVATGLAEYVTSPFFTDSPTQELVEMPPAKRTKTTEGSSATVAPAVKKYVKKCMDGRLLEDKITLIGPSTVVPGTSGAVFSLGVPLIVEGTGDSNRTGNIIKIKSFHFEYFTYDAASHQQRVVVFRDTQANGTTPTITDVLASANVISPFNRGNVKQLGGSRYDILSDELVVVNLQVAATNAVSGRHKKWYKGGFPVKFLNSTGVATDVATNNLWVAVVANNGTSTIAYNGTIKFTDN